MAFLLADAMRVEACVVKPVISSAAGRMMGIIGPDYGGFLGGQLSEIADRHLLKFVSEMVTGHGERYRISYAHAHFDRLACLNIR